MDAPKKSFCVAPMFDTLAHDDNHDIPPHMAHDATYVFKPYMEHFKHIYPDVTAKIIFNQKNALDNTKAEDNRDKAHRNETVSQQFWHELDAAPSSLDAVVYFGHGTPASLASLGIGPKSVETLAEKIRKKCNPGVKVVLYACSTGNWKGKSCFTLNGRKDCFAGHLASLLSDQSAVVFGHSTVGHSTTNPNMYRFFGTTREPVVPESMFKTFHKKLLSDTFENFHKKKGQTINNLWARVPFMTSAELKSEVMSL